MPGQVALHEDVSQISCESDVEGNHVERECTIYYQDSWQGEPSDSYPDVVSIHTYVDADDHVDMELGDGSEGSQILFDDRGVNCRVDEVGGPEHDQHYFQMKCGVGFGE